MSCSPAPCASPRSFKSLTSLRLRRLVRVPARRRTGQTVLESNSRQSPQEDWQTDIDVCIYEVCVLVRQCVCVSEAISVSRESEASREVISVRACQSASLCLPVARRERVPCVSERTSLYQCACVSERTPVARRRAHLRDACLGACQTERMDPLTSISCLMLQRTELMDPLTLGG